MTLLTPTITACPAELEKDKILVNLDQPEAFGISADSTDTPEILMDSVMNADSVSMLKRQLRADMR